MRHSTLIVSFVLLAQTASAVPVFLKPESRFATGNQSRTKLEQRTYRTQTQRWFRVRTKDHAYGWIAEDHALTALKLVEQATLTETVPARTSVIDNAPTAVLPAQTPVMLLEFQGSWARVQPLTEVELPQAWVPTEKLRANFAMNIAQRAFIYQTAALRVDASATARVLKNIEEGTYVSFVRTRGDFVEIRTDRLQGFVPKSAVWTASDLGEKGIRAGVALAPLRAQPLPYAELVRSLPYSATLVMTSAQTLKWGLASTHEQGDVWWPMTEEVVNEMALRPSDLPEKFTTAEVFSRKIFDMAASRSIPSLKFASADGIFRTVDGATWTKIPLFRDQNYPIAVSRSGSIFVGPYVSDDNGETFQQWIRWDSLVSSLKDGVNAQNLKIVEIRPEDSTGHKVSLRLEVGGEKPIRVATDDQGLSWKSL